MLIPTPHKRSLCAINLIRPHTNVVSVLCWSELLAGESLPPHALNTFPPFPKRGKKRGLLVALLSYPRRVVIVIYAYYYFRNARNVLRTLRKTIP